MTRWNKYTQPCNGPWININSKPALGLMMRTVKDTGLIVKLTPKTLWIQFQNKEQLHSIQICIKVSYLCSFSCYKYYIWILFLFNSEWEWGQQKWDMQLATLKKCKGQSDSARTTAGVSLCQHNDNYPAAQTQKEKVWEVFVFSLFSLATLGTSIKCAGREEGAGKGSSECFLMKWVFRLQQNSATLLECFHAVIH